MDLPDYGFPAESSDEQDEQAGVESDSSVDHVEDEHQIYPPHLS